MCVHVNPLTHVPLAHVVADTKGEDMSDEIEYLRKHHDD